jgi:hypothetical protein
MYFAIVDIGYCKQFLLWNKHWAIHELNEIGGKKFKNCHRSSNHQQGYPKREVFHFIITTIGQFEMKLFDEIQPISLEEAAPAT